MPVASKTLPRDESRLLGVAILGGTAAMIVNAAVDNGSTKM
jgi:hypothetical protein